jgi:hypothetical protein
MLVDRNAVEAQYGGPLDWNRAEDNRACFVKAEGVGAAGWRTDDDDREAGMTSAATALIRFHEALAPTIVRVGET